MCLYSVITCSCISLLACSGYKLVAYIKKLPHRDQFLSASQDYCNVTGGAITWFGGPPGGGAGPSWLIKTGSRRSMGLKGLLIKIAPEPPLCILLLNLLLVM